VAGARSGLQLDFFASAFSHDALLLQYAAGAKIGQDSINTVLVD
jgi:hypothetical protein